MRKKASPVKKKSRHDTSTKERAVAKKKTASSRKPKIEKTGVHRGIPYDSYNEYYTIDWLEELRVRGYVLSYRRADSYTLTESVKHTYFDEKGKPRSQHIMHGSVYTPEFEVIWNEENFRDFIWLMGENAKNVKPLIGHRNDAGQVFTIIECKSDYDRNNGIRMFTNNMKVLFAKYGVYVNLVQPATFFERTFTPASFLTTPAGMERKLKYTPTDVDKYLQVI